MVLKSLNLKREIFMHIEIDLDFAKEIEHRTSQRGQGVGATWHTGWGDDRRRQRPSVGEADQAHLCGP